MKLTRQDIENLANDVVAFLERHGLDEDVHLFYNGNGLSVDRKWDEEKQCNVPYRRFVENVSPFNWFEAEEWHIFSMMFDEDSDLSRMIYHFKDDELRDVFKKYGLYYEYSGEPTPFSCWNATAYPITLCEYHEKGYNHYDGIEYVSYVKQRIFNDDAVKNKLIDYCNW